MAANKVMSIADAAEKVLAAAGIPMHYGDITERIQQEGFAVSASQTPAISVYVCIRADIKQRTQNGQPQRFEFLGKGNFGLTASKGDAITLKIAEHNKATMEALVAKMHGLTPAEFEALVGEILALLGFEDILVTKITKDGGIDAHGTLNVQDALKFSVGVQAKRLKADGKVSPKDIQALRGSLASDQVGLFITTGVFTLGATKDAKKAGMRPVWLINGQKLAQLVCELELPSLNVKAAHHLVFDVG